MPRVPGDSYIFLIFDRFDLDLRRYLRRHGAFRGDQLRHCSRQLFSGSSSTRVGHGAYICLYIPILHKVNKASKLRESPKTSVDKLICYRKPRILHFILEISQSNEHKISTTEASDREAWHIVINGWCFIGICGLEKSSVAV